VNYAISNPNTLSAISSTSSSGDFAVKLINAFIAGGWTVAATITGGKTLQGLSPQGYLVWCDVWASDASTVSIMLHSAVGSGCTGYAHQLHWDTAYGWQVLAHPCGFFISQPLFGASLSGTSCMGGIPMVAAGCGLAAALGSVTECWFSFGDYSSSPFFYARSPRSNIDVGDGDSLGGTTLIGTETGCWDGHMSTYTAPWDSPQILRFSPASVDQVGVSLANDSHPLFFGEGFMDYPAFVAWSSATGAPIQIRGQVYNACVRSSTMERNAPAVSGGYNMISYTDSYFWGTLLVSMGAAAAVGNIAY